ncbi:hypothetical protein AB0D57_35855 [Streptomyces sp. NPDC048275]|uniref:hypothetical protein n=1 Tax=Streptomyces sp. NPDC048275 TaxID=3155629 RepID=UPI0033F42C3F
MPEPTGDSEDTSIGPAGGESTAASAAGPAERRRYLRSLGRTAGHGLVYGLASATGGAIVTGLVWWNQR